MKTLIERVLRVWWMTALAVVLFAGCKTYVPVETVRVETERVVDVQRDSIYVRDSIYIREANDTIYITKWRVEYKEALRVDTFNIERIDTLNTIVEIEAKLTKWQQTKMDVGTGVMWMAPAFIIAGLFLLYRMLRK